MINITEDINLNWLRDISIQILQGKVTMSQAAEQAKFSSFYGTYVKKISTDTLHKLFVRNGIQCFEAGRKGKANFIDPASEDFIKKNFEDLHIGTRKMYELCQDQHVQVSRRQVEAVYKRISPGKTQETQKDDTKTRYNAEEVNSIWHGDIHEIKAANDTPTKRYLYAIIDDCSRFIVAFGISDNKTCDFVSKIFQTGMLNAGRAPLIYWSDNGLENLGHEMKEIYEANNIKHVRTRPHCPQSNGKIERFWRGIKGAIKNKNTWEEIETTIENYVNYYNKFNHHHGLQKIGTRFQTPQDVYFDPTKQATDRAHSIIDVDGDRITLARFCGENEEHQINFLEIENLLN